MGDATKICFDWNIIINGVFFCMGKSARYGGFNGNLLDSWRF